MIDSIEEQASYQTREEFLRSMGERWDRVNKPDNTPPMPAPAPGSFEARLEEVLSAGMWATPSSSNPR